MLSIPYKIKLTGRAKGFIPNKVHTMINVLPDRIISLSSPFR